MSVQVTIQQLLTVNETLSVGVPDVAASAAPIRHDQFNNGPKTLNATSTPPASMSSSDQLTGTQTLDLTALPGVNGAVQNGTGLKVQAVMIQNPKTNTGALAVSPGAANPYPIWGAGNALDIPLGGSIELDMGGNQIAVSATQKTILFTPAAGGDKYNVVIVLG